ncbi:MAG: HEPN domain-containing protein [Candidatus Nanohaloarchaeota archaeon QJJ-9]|nr:HEPN domain-containing protein [Candidatus Nanohaloarchaeota archaeon QJJ-9]
MSEVKEEIKLAKKSLQDLEIVGEASLRLKYTTLYFAAYHAARAALLNLKYSPKSHSGIDSLVHNILLREKGKIEPEEASLFSKLKTRREQADYETGFYGSEEEFEELYKKSKNLIDSLIEIAEED